MSGSLSNAGKEVAFRTDKVMSPYLRLILPMTCVNIKELAELGVMLGNC